MEKYIGTKMINAKPMSRLEYDELRGWQVPADENPEDEGYLVEYCDKHNRSNIEGFDGYVSWSPKAVFDDAYHKADGLTFGLAIDTLKQGCKVARAGWNGKGMFLTYVKNRHYGHGKSDCEAVLKHHFLLQGVDGNYSVWVPSVSDALAEDWYIVA